MLATVLGLETQGPPAGAQHPSVLAEVTHANNSLLPSPVAGQLRQKKQARRFELPHIDQLCPIFRTQNDPLIPAMPVTVCVIYDKANLDKIRKVMPS